MGSTLYVAQHRPPADTPDIRMVVGYFISFSDAEAALDELYEDGCWQGIRNDGVHRRWWRGCHQHDWNGPQRIRVEYPVP